MKKISVEGQAKKIPQGQMMTPVESQIKKAEPSSRQGRRPMTSTP